MVARDVFRAFCMTGTNESQQTRTIIQLEHQRENQEVVVYNAVKLIIILLLLFTLKVPTGGPESSPLCCQTFKAHRQKMFQIESQMKKILGFYFYV